jgi:ribosomal protein RSM22 (predicted rRNA methylase)
MKNLIKNIKKKKELSGVADDVIARLIGQRLASYHTSLDQLKPKEQKLLLKLIRADLRQLTGMFHPKRTKANRQDLLATHASTAERLPHYGELKRKIAALKPKSILDLGCGLNPVALAISEVTYHAADINSGDLELVKKHFQKNKLPGSTFVFDLQHQPLSELPKADLILLFKVIDLIDRKKGHKVTEHLLTTLNYKHLLISFPKIKLSGKPMKYPERCWLTLMLNRLDLEHERFTLGNELFYLITKN